MQDPCVLPQFQCCPSHILDTHSITTEVDYLYKEEKHSLRYDSPILLTNAIEVTQSPHVIMDCFLDGCHQRVWKGSNESLCNTPLPQHQNNVKLGEQCQDLNLDCMICESNSIDDHSQLNPDSIVQFSTNAADSLDNANITVTYYAGHNTVCGNPTEDYAPMSLPPEHCFTDDEGYLHFKDKTSV